MAAAGRSLLLALVLLAPRIQAAQQGHSADRQQLRALLQTAPAFMSERVSNGTCAIDAACLARLSAAVNKCAIVPGPASRKVDQACIVGGREDSTACARGHQ